MEKQETTVRGGEDGEKCNATSEASAEKSRLVCVLHGPNLNLLGQRDPAVYGMDTLSDIEDLMRERAASLGLAVEFFQSNREGVLVEAVQSARSEAHGIVINPGALTHYSRALQDALSILTIPVVEVHLSNVHAREEWRRLSVISPVSTGTITGFGVMGYVFALDALAGLFAKERRGYEHSGMPTVGDSA